MQIRLLLILLLGFTILNSAESISPNTDSLKTESVLDVDPTFNEGDPAVEFHKFIDENLVYPKICQDNDIEGRTVSKIIIDKKGKLSKIYVIDSNDPAFTRETKRVLKKSPRWTPGIIDGETVEVIYTVPINFILK